MSSEITRKLASRLRNIRKEKNLTQEKLSLMCGFEKDYIYRIENLKRSPRLEYLDKIAKNLNMTIAELLTFDE